jgi:hypothetical protein
MSPAEPFLKAFRQDGETSARGKFLSRVFGIFSEEIVRIWAADDRAPYRCLGRPTLTYLGSQSTLDFLFQCAETGKRFVVEQKCEIEYCNYRYLTLTSPDQLHHHRKPAFEAFLAAARPEHPHAPTIKVARQEVSTEGAILIWGAVADEGRRSVMEATGLHDIIALNDIIEDCRRWRSDDYLELIDNRHRWSEELFEYLGSEPHQ